jgi:hypothetical protein
MDPSIWLVLALAQLSCQLHGIQSRVTVLELQVRVAEWKKRDARCIGIWHWGGRKLQVQGTHCEWHERHGVDGQLGRPPEQRRAGQLAGVPASSARRRTRRAPHPP